MSAHRKVKFADDYKINEAAAANLNHAPFDLADPVKSLQLGMLLTLMYGFVLRPHQSTLVTRSNVGISKMEGSMSFGTSDTINIVTRCTYKSGNENPEQLFAVKTFDSRCFSIDFWMALNDVYTNDVRLPRQGYVCKTGRFEGRHVSSLVQMTAEGLTGMLDVCECWHCKVGCSLMATKGVHCRCCHGAASHRPYHREARTSGACL